MNGNALTVYFNGICTHVTEGGQMISPPTHRVLLVGGGDGAYINGAKIPPHYAMLKINPADIVGTDGYLYGLQGMEHPGVWRITGARFDLVGAKGKFNLDPTYKALVPSLSNLTPRIPPLFPEVVYGDRAAGYFDLRSGTLSAAQTKPDGPIFTVLNVETDSSPGLRVTCFWNQESRVISLKPGTTIYVENVGFPMGDSSRDFLLHYRALQSIPSDAGVPPDFKPADHPMGDTVACSNSTYP